jgi:hypothetical protein
MQAGRRTELLDTAGECLKKFLVAGFGRELFRFQSDDVAQLISFVRRAGSLSG